MMVLGNPRAYTLFDPVRQSGAPCGWVDTLDFPINPPNAENAFGGSDFGNYRARYEKYHAGEDWGLSNRGNFGQPVHSIGHGQVTYAQPMGWGADKGVVIVRHSFPDGDSVLSFYGHLDPPSVTLREGDCVWRGDIVGKIGRPRTPPHLHFEMRVHLPYSTGSGYWPTDPAQAGWLPPSKTISQYRMRVSPGATWTDISTPEYSMPLGTLDDSIYLTLDDGRLAGIDLLTGDELWSYELTESIRDTLLDSNRGVLYTTDSTAGLVAYALPKDDEDESLPEELVPLWEYEIPSSSRMDLMSLPGGGTLVSYNDALRAISLQGDLLWEIEDEDSKLVSWALTEEILVFTTSNQDAPLRTADADGVYLWEDGLVGRPLVAGDQIWLYAKEGLYRLNLSERTVQRVYVLPAEFMRRSTALPLQDGSLVLLHSDLADRRLLSFDAEGDLQWEFSVPLAGEPKLFELKGRIYLLTKPFSSTRGNYKTMEIFVIDPEQRQLVRIFQAGSRMFNPLGTWANEVNGEQLLIQIAGNGRVLFNPEAALNRMGQ
jgi:outer membrane protein assembly factor BamB